MFANRLLSLGATFLFATVSAAQNAAPAASPAVNSSSNEAEMAKLVALQNDFIETIKTDGFQPSLAPPTIVLDNPPSYGNYEDERNVLHIAVWSALSPERKRALRGWPGYSVAERRAKKLSKMGCTAGFSSTNSAIGGRRASTKPARITIP